MEYESNPPIVDVMIRRTVDLSRLAVLDEGRAGSEDGIVLNLSYADMRGWSLEDARLIVHQEQDFLDQLAEVGWTTDEASAIIDDHMSEASELSWFDPGVAGAVFALSAAGPPRSVHATEERSEAIAIRATRPTSWWAAGPKMQAAAIANALESVGMGIVPNGEFAEIFADDILKFHAFAERLLDELED